MKDGLLPANEPAAAPAHALFTNQEHPAPMLDVHAPQHTVHTWKDFLVHLATIVIGLLIAVGLEQLVEQAHDHYKVRETRVTLQQERTANGKDLVTNAHNWRWEMAELQNNLMVLEYVQRHPGVPQTSLPGDLRWIQLPIFSNRAVWEAAQQNGVIRLMPLDEADSDQTLYQYLQTLTEQGNSAWNAISDSRRFAIQDPDPTHLSPLQLADAIQLTQIAIEKHLQVGFSIALINSVFPDLPRPSPMRRFEVTYAPLSRTTRREWLPPINSPWTDSRLLAMCRRTMSCLHRRREPSN
jgi:hypothetical protein